MLEFDNIRLDLESYDEPLVKLKEALHIDHVSDQISELEQRSQEPDFWNDVDRAQSLQQNLGKLKKKVESYNQLVSTHEDLLALCELANDEEDINSLPELTENVRLFKDDVEKMRLETLFTGEYDANNAILTLHAGAGGTEAMDWTSMLYRMYNRWAEFHGFTVKELEFLEGEEVCGVFAVLEDVGRGAVDGHGAREGLRVGAVAAVQAKGFELHGLSSSWLLDKGEDS